MVTRPQGVVEMTETQRRELEAFLAEQKLIGGITPSKLKHNTIIWVDTENYLFKITLDNSYGTPKYIVESGFYMSIETCCMVNSYYPRLDYIMRDYLGRGLKLMLVYANGSVIHSGSIKNVTISGKDYSYDVWS